METTDGTACNGNEEAREQRIDSHISLGTQPCRILVQIGITQIAPKFWQCRPFQEQTDHQRSCHKQKRKSEERIYLTDNLINRQQCCYDIIKEDNQYPHHLTAPYIFQYHSRAVHKYSTHHHQKQYREYQHHFFCCSAEILAHQLRQSSTAITDTEHTTHIIVHSSCKDTAEDDPQIRHRSVPGTHDSSKNWSRSRNIEELNHKDFPTWQYHEVDTIGFGHCWRRTVVRTEHFRHKFSIKHVAQNKSH